MHNVGPITFLERYLRIYNLDLTKTDVEASAISSLARAFCKMMLRDSGYLDIKPSQLAASALTLAVNISKSPIAESLGIYPIMDPKLDSLMADNLVSIEMDGVVQSQPNESCPFKMWTATVLRTTGLSLEVDLRPNYLNLITIVDQ